jgi:hypothetical protein
MPPINVKGAEIWFEAGRGGGGGHARGSQRDSRLRILLLADEVIDTVIDATKERTAAQVTHTTASRLF